ncbi:MAG: YraN family protein [Candidatus Limnocylindria bacterium]
MADPRHRFGIQAEDAAAAWLARCGWTILARRYRSAGGGEVDLVVLDPRRQLVGVEVRARHSRRTGAPEETVDPRRARRIARSLVAFAVNAGVRHDGLRVDLVAVETAGSGVGEYRLSRLPGIDG